ncbi:odorant receptor 67c-like [Trichogramma pretiosum]|uniref:odorant receptor 67c-like n=1 Tax=Trichogramma pretiosum TaxID=7493 RepID=UPI000C71C9A1|nr:odorant receptor 67c-like [Trichogramma pretiosum]
MSGKFESIEEFYDQPFFSLNKFTFRMSGWWPFQETKKRQMIWSFVWFCIVTVVVPEVIYLIQIIKDLTKVIECFMALTITYAAFTMAFNAWHNNDSLKKILEHIHANWEDLQDEHELRIFSERAAVSRLLNVIYALMVFYNIMIHTVSPLIPPAVDWFVSGNWSRPEKNLLEVEYLVLDPDEYYTLIYVHGAQAGFLVVFVIVTCDTFFMTITQHSCGMFMLLGYRIRKMDEDIFEKRCSSSYATRRVKEIVFYHRDCLRFTQLLEATMSVMFLFQLFPTVIMISVVGAQAMIRAKAIEELIKFGFIFISMIFRLFFICWCSQNIMDSSLAVMSYLTNTRWYEYPESTKKLFTLMFMRCAKPSYLTAGNVFTLNFVTYAGMIKTSMSYLTMILQTQESNL